MFRFRSPERVGVLLCLVAGASFALQPVLVRLAFDSGAGVATVGTIRFVLAAAVFALLARTAIAAAPVRTLLPPFVLGLTIYGLETGLFFASLERIDVSLASLLMCSYPALVVAGAVLLRRERPSRRRAVALVVALGGVALVLAGGVGGAIDPVGIGLALSAAIAYAAYVLVSDRLLGTTEPLVLATMLCAGAATAFALGGAATGPPEGQWVSLVSAPRPARSRPRARRPCSSSARSRSWRPCCRSRRSSAAYIGSGPRVRRFSARSSRP
jgi:drug/metabolite transporter (DMT)-like permease